MQQRVRLKSLLTSFAPRRQAPARCRVPTFDAALVAGVRRYNTVVENDGLRGDDDGEERYKGSVVESIRTGQSAAWIEDVRHHDEQPKNLVSRYVPCQKVALVPESISRQITPDLEILLQKEVANTSPKIPTVTAILRELIYYRCIRPQLRHYRALILANTDPLYGSPENVRQLLNEMERYGITADSSTLHAALQALAVHPNYLLRHNILRALRDRWLTLSPTGWHHLVTGLVREGQFEMALDRLNHMTQFGVRVESWLHGLVIYSLCELGDFDQILDLMKSRADQGQDISVDLWMYVLKIASQSVHYETTSYVWKQMVELRYLNPSHDICGNVLTVASRTGDIQLAESVIRFLTETEVSLFQEDYEKVTETYLMSGDLTAAFAALCSMHEHGIRPGERSTRSILKFMIHRQIRPVTAWSKLTRLKKLKRKVPVGCANVIFEYCEHAHTRKSNRDSNALLSAIRFYKELYALCPAGADVNTYNILISLCRRAKRPDVCIFFVKEMAALGVSPDATTLEYLILICLDARNFRSANMYFSDFLERGWILSDSTAAEMRQLCDNSEDEFALLIREHPMLTCVIDPTNYAETLSQIFPGMVKDDPDFSLSKARPVSSEPLNAILGQIFKLYDGDEGTMENFTSDMHAGAGRPFYSEGSIVDQDRNIPKT